jgi:hypothetical protein
MLRKGKGMKRIIREEQRYHEKKKQGRKSWRHKKGKIELDEGNMIT